MARRASAPWTYAAAGVDRGEVGGALAALRRRIRARVPPGHGRPLSLPGHYAGVSEVDGVRIAVTTDTVGTKVLLAAEAGRWSEVGEDMVAINVNDLAALGARPFGFVDTISCARPDVRVFAELGRGLDRGLAAGRCALLGGETAVVPDLVPAIDLGGTAIGFYPARRAPVTGSRVRRGDVLLGIPSRGLHANGFTLVRRLVSKARAPLDRPRPGGRMPLGRELLRPTRTYVAVSEALAGDPALHGLAHLSGGGVRNLVRLGSRLGFTLDAWPDPGPFYRWLQSLGPVADREMFQTFNMGIGFVAVVAPSAVDRLTGLLRRAGVRDARPIGRVDGRPGVHLPAWGLSYRGYA